LPITEKHFYQF